MERTNKRWKVMRLCVLFSIIFTWNASASVFSQLIHFEKSGLNTTVKDVLKTIERQTDYTFFYNDAFLDLNRPFRVEKKDIEVGALLNALFKDTGLTYREHDNKFIVITPKVSVQSIVITGTVTDETGEPMPGVSILLKGTTRGVASDGEGRFSITVPGDDAVLIFSYIGYARQEVTVGSRRSIRVMLAEDNKQIEEIVVVGYSTQKKENLTAAISTIKAEDIQTTTNTSVVLKLQGKLPGLNIRQNNGQPGEYDNAINIRGFGVPLYVIDGVERPANIFQRLNSSDIESITILKDASAAIYGLNAANGVVIVTTKQGKKEKTDFQFSSSVGFSTPTDVPRMSNAYEYYTLRNEANVNVGLAPFIEKEELERWRIGGPGYESTDWAGATFDDYSVRQEYNLSANGGTERVSFFFNLGGLIDNGMLKTGDLFYQRLTFRSNISAQLTDHIRAVANVFASNDKREAPAWGFHEIWRGTVVSLPTKKIYANDNPLYLNRVQDGQGMNPVALSSAGLTGYSRSNSNNYITSLELIYDVPFIKGLQLKALGAYDKTYGMGKGVTKDFALYDYDVDTETYAARKFRDPASISNSYENVWYLTGRGQVNYRTSINDAHHISAMAVYEIKDAAGRYASILKYYDFFTNDQVDQASDTDAQSGGNEWQRRSMSYIGKVNYDWKGRYLVEFAGRYDGSYRYHPDRRWGLFPVVSAGWRISDEKFMAALSSVLSNMKLRASYGKIGQDVGNPFQYVPGFTTADGGWWEFTDGVTTLGLSTPAIVNERLTWMTSTLKDAGIDLSFFKHKLEFTFDLYQKDRSGLLARRSVSLPNTYGGTFPQENLNKDRVRGFDLSFDYKNSIGDVNYKISGNFNHARTQAVYVEQGNFANSWTNYRSNQVGRYQGLVWTHKVTGRYRSDEEIQQGAIQNGTLGNRYVLPGDFIYKDASGDGVIDDNDLRPYFYNATPRMHYGMNLGASWKGFDANVFFQGAAKFSLSLTGPYTIMFAQEANVPAYFMDRWHREDPYDPESKWIPGKFPAMRTVDQAGGLYTDSDAWRKDCSYVRLKNVSVGYTLPQRYVKKAGLDNVRLYVDVSNLYTWADSFVKPYDPEKVAGAFDSGWNYPIMRIWNTGLNINF